MKCSIHSESGIAMPIALIIMLVMTVVSAVFYQMAQEELKIMTSNQATNNMFLVAEGAVNEAIRQFSTSAHLWRAKPNLSTLPASYQLYSPTTYAGTNGIPTCSGSGCQRNYYPTGGGFLKNVGPIGGDGDNTDNAYSITEQLVISEPQTADVTLNDQSGWYQVERLDEVQIGAQNLGGNLDNNPVAGEGVTSVRYRLTGYSLKDIKGSSGRSVIVSVVEVPST